MVDIRESEHKNKREFSRVDIRLPLEVRLVPPEQKRLMCNRLERVLTGTKLPPDVADPLLAEWLRLLNTKLDNILSTLATNEDVHELPPLRTESLSGGGASFTSTEEYQPGDLLELKIMFDSFLTGTLHLCGEVVQKEETAGGYLIAVSFLFLEEDLQDEIVKFVFEKEREILRKKRKE